MAVPAQRDGSLKQQLQLTKDIPSLLITQRMTSTSLHEAPTTSNITGVLFAAATGMDEVRALQHWCCAAALGLTQEQQHML